MKKHPWYQGMESLFNLIAMVAAKILKALTTRSAQLQYDAQAMCFWSKRQWAYMNMYVFLKCMGSSLLMLTFLSMSSVVFAATEIEYQHEYKTSPVKPALVYKKANSASGFFALITKNDTVTVWASNGSYKKVTIDAGNHRGRTGYVKSNYLLAQGYSELRHYQSILKTLGFDPGPIDGRSGPKTTAAIVRFQRSRGLQADGKIGPITARALNNPGDLKGIKITTSSTFSETLYDHQRILKELGFNPGPIDGLLGRRTISAIRLFQASRKLTVDGIIGPETKLALETASFVKDNSATTPSRPPVQSLPQPEPVASRSIHYVAIGDSYAAGAGLSEELGYGIHYGNIYSRIEDEDCERHDSSYPARTARYLESNYEPVVFTFAACTGAKIADGKHNATDQIKYVSSELQRADVVTVMIGGNDLDWTDVVTRCASVWSRVPSLDLNIDLNPFNGGLVEIDIEGSCTHGRSDLEQRVQDVLIQLDQFYDQVIESAPVAKEIYVVGYPHVVPAQPKNFCAPFVDGGISSAEIQMLRDLSSSFNKGMRELVGSKENMTFVEMIDTFQGREPCTEAEWINSLHTNVEIPIYAFPIASPGSIGVSSQSFHPKAVGHQKMFERIGPILDRAL